MSLNMSPAGLNSSTLTMLGAGLLNSNVTTLDLSCNKIDRSGVSALAQVLTSTKIRKLSMRNVGLEDIGCATLATVLPRTQIQVLTLTDNKITHVGACALAFHVIRCALLTTLHVTVDEVGLVGTTALIEGLGSRADAVMSTLCIFNKNRTKSDEAHLTDLAAQFPNIGKCFFKSMAFLTWTYVREYL
ncbi:Aste57867_9701 [Aphanomyces stellatus]|nr:hypothetical protein As57867_009663 [Aphanomyces stellatus]VFT86580.1 Aste57867_9701 [Aphanomyces stellatus]